MPPPRVRPDKNRRRAEISMDEITGNMQSFLDELDRVYTTIAEEDKVCGTFSYNRTMLCSMAGAGGWGGLRPYGDDVRGIAAWRAVWA